MGLPALKIELEVPVEERVARLEANVEHIQSDVSEMKTDVRRLDTKIDGVKDSVNAVELKIMALDVKMEKSFAAFNEKINESFSKLKIGRALDKVWWLLIAGAILGVMARGFKWL